MNKSLLAARRGRSVDHLMTFLLGCSADSQATKDGQYVHENGRRGRPFWIDGTRYEIVEVYRDGKVAAVKAPANPWCENSEILLFDADQIDEPCVAPCGLSECGDSGAHCKRGRAR